MTHNNPESNRWIVQVTAENFQAEVMDRSADVLVIVDFWASWCQPCRVLAPLLEEVTRQYAGQVVLAKIDTEQAPDLAAQFGVQSIPAVYAVRQGQVVDGFVGALPEPQVQQWLERLLPSSAERLVEQAQQLQASEPAAAEKSYRQAIEADPNLASAQIGLAQLLLDQQRLDECGEVIEQLEQRGFLEPEAERVRAALERQRRGEAAGDVASCRAALAQTPDDPQLQLRLAEALAAEQQYDEALQVCLDVVQAGGGDWRERGRQIMVDIFRLLPEDSELARDYRRKLSMALF